MATNTSSGLAMEASPHSAYCCYSVVPYTRVGVHFRQNVARRDLLFVWCLLLAAVGVLFPMAAFTSTYIQEHTISICPKLGATLIRNSILLILIL